MLVIHDDLDQDYGKLRLQKNRGPGGHNGLKSVNQLLGTQDYMRLKVGIGRSLKPSQDVASYVLEPFSKDEQQTLKEYAERAADCALAVVKDGFERASNHFNQDRTIQPGDK